MTNIYSTSLTIRTKHQNTKHLNIPVNQYAYVGDIESRALMF